MNREDLIPIDEFCVHHQIEASFISALQNHGMIEIIVTEENDYFSLDQLSSVEKIIRLHYELDINLEGIDAIMNLLDHIDDIKNQLLTAQNKLDFFEKR